VSVLLTVLIIAFVVWAVGFRLYQVASAALHLLIALAIVRLIFRLAWGGPRTPRTAATDRPRPARRVPLGVTDRLTSGTAG
jgi:hypothetical protein